MKRNNKKKLVKFIVKVIKEEIAEDRTLSIAKDLAKDTPGRQPKGLTTLNGKIVTVQDKGVSNFEKKVQPELVRVIDGLKFYLKYLPKNSTDYNTVVDIITRALENGKIPSSKEQAMVSYLAGKHGLKEQGAGSGMELGIAGNNPTNFGIDTKITKNQVEEIIRESVEEELVRRAIRAMIHEQLKKKDLNENFKTGFSAILIALSLLGGASAPAKGQELNVPSANQIQTGNLKLAKYVISGCAVVIYKTVDGEIKLMIALPFQNAKNAGLIRTTSITIANQAMDMYEKQTKSESVEVVFRKMQLSDSKEFLIAEFDTKAY